jgi:hypothetical protein
MLPAVSGDAPRPCFLVCEDGTEYIERFRRFLGHAFAFVPAPDLGAALAAAAADPPPRAVLCDLDFRRTPPDRLVDERGAPPAADDEGTRRRLAGSQGIFILRALRARGVRLPAVLFADLADAEQARFLERTLAPLVVAPSSVGLGEIAALLAGLAGPAAGAT